MHFSSGISSRLLQASQIVKWLQYSKLSAINGAEECVEARQVCAILFVDLENAITGLPSHEVGTLYAVLRKAAWAMTMFMTDNRAEPEMTNACTELQRWVQVRCPNTAIRELSLEALWVLTRKIIVQQASRWLRYLEAMENRRDGLPETPKQSRRFMLMNHAVAVHVCDIIFRATLPQLHHQYSTSEMMGFVRAHRREFLFVDDTCPWPSVDMVQYATNDTETEYRAAGERVRPWEFCAPTEAGGVTECSICMSETLPGFPTQNVITKCGHVYHWTCLDHWVNESGMKTSNTCPTCRAVMCRPRQRLHASVDDHAMEPRLPSRRVSTLILLS